MEGVRSAEFKGPRTRQGFRAVDLRVARHGECGEWASNNLDACNGAGNGLPHPMDYQFMRRTDPYHLETVEPIVRHDRGSDSQPLLQDRYAGHDIERAIAFSQYRDAQMTGEWVFQKRQ